MNNTKYDIQVLKEIKSIYERPEATKAKYSRTAIVLLTIGFVAAFLLQYLLKHTESHPNFLIFGLVVSGCSIGIGFFHVLAGMQVPYFNKYTSLDMEAIDKRLNCGPNE